MGFKVDFSQLDWGAVDNKLRGRPDEVALVVAKHDRMAARIGGRVSTTRRGVPHIVVSKEKVTYSISWYRGSNYWRIFYPYPSWGADVTVLNLSTDEEVVKYFG